MTTGSEGRTIAQIVQPFSRLPAGMVALLADAALSTLEREHAQGQFGLDTRPEAWRLDERGVVTFSPTTTPAAWLASPEGGASAGGDLFALGAVLVELLIGRRPLDAGSDDATAAFRARLTTPPPLFSLWPTIPGFLERLLVALLQPDPKRRVDSAASARASLAPVVALLHEQAPGALAALARDAAPACARVHELQAQAEAARGALLVATPTTIRGAVVSLLRAHALLPGTNPQVAQLLTQAASAGVVRGARAQPPELVQTLSRIAAAEPSPPAQELRHAATLHEQCGDVLEAIGLMKRALLLQPQNRILVGKLNELTSAAFDATNPWSAGGAWALEPLEKKGTPTQAKVPVFEGAADDSPARQLARSAAQLYAGIEPRRRLFLLAMSLSALMVGALWCARSSSEGGAVAARAQLDVLATQGADCPTGGKALLLQAWQAARLHEARAIDQLVAHNEALLPAGTRCHLHAVSLSAQAASARGPLPDGDPSLDDVLASLATQGVAVAERTEQRGAIQQELENMNEAIATGAPIPKLTRRLTLDGIATDWFVCPGKAAQANSLIAVSLRGAEPSDAPTIAMAADVLTGSLLIAVGHHVVSMSPKPEQDDAALKVARALAASMQ